MALHGQPWYHLHSMLPAWSRRINVPAAFLLPSTLRLEITDAAGLLADSELERFLGRGRLGARLGEIVGKADNLAFNQTTIENAKQQ